MQPLLRDLAFGDQATPIAHRRPHRLHRIIDNRPALTLPGQVGQRGAVAIIGLEPTRPELRPRGRLNGGSTRAAFVATNSITQGEQVEPLWKPLLDAGLVINFAHRTFLWTSEARGKAAVHVVIIGFSDTSAAASRRVLIDYPTGREPVGNVSAAKTITPYLIDAEPVIVTSRRKPIGQVPEMAFGSMPNDNGNLLLTDDEAQLLCATDPVAAGFLRELISTNELLHGARRWCLWVPETTDPALIKQSTELTRRAKTVQAQRGNSNRSGTRKSAAFPLRFGEVRQPAQNYLCVPRHTAQTRDYVPMVFCSPSQIAHDSTMTITGADRFIFGVLSSDVFTTWLATVGGRIRADFRISAEVVYNNFPFPDVTPATRTRIADAAQGVLDARNQFPSSTLADLYDPTAMPGILASAHNKLDLLVRRQFKKGKHSLTTFMGRQEALMEAYVSALRAGQLPEN